MFVLELEHLQEEFQRTEAEEKENRQVEIQGSRVRSKRVGRRQQQELGESQLLQTFQEGVKVSLNWPISYWSMLVETLICPLNILMSTEKRWKRRDSCITSNVQHAWREESPKNNEKEEKLSAWGVCVCVGSVCAFKFDCKTRHQSLALFSLEPMLVQETKSMKII